jgi:hypothetical protein
MLIYFRAIWNILQIFGYFINIGYICVHLVHFSGFGIMYLEKSGNPAIRVNRWDEFSLTGLLITIHRMFFVTEVAQIYGLLFFHGKSYVVILTKK